MRGSVARLARCSGTRRLATAQSVWVMRTTGGPGLISDCRTYLDACADPAFFRITADGPSVIGWDELIAGTRRPIEASLHAARDRGEIADTPVEPIARMLAAALKEAGVMIATAADPATARAQADEAALRLISGLLTPS